MTNPIQAYVDAMNAKWADERSQTQLTLGAAIDLLENVDPDTLVAGLGAPHSYRGYYTDLAFEPESNRQPASEALATLRSCMGKTFTGYKGGDFVMHENTPLWEANYGCTGRPILSMHRVDGVFVLELGDDD